MNKKYRDYLDSAEWKTIRDIKLKEADNKCEQCGSRRRLQVHHLTYRHIFNEYYHLEDLLVVCKACHEAIHRQGKKPDKKKPKRKLSKKQAKKQKLAGQVKKAARAKRSTILQDRALSKKQKRLKRKATALKKIENQPVNKRVTLGITRLR